jgi:hypothetical protein
LTGWESFKTGSDGFRYVYDLYLHGIATRKCIGPDFSIHDARMPVLALVDISLKHFLPMAVVMRPLLAIAAHNLMCPNLKMVDVTRLMVWVVVARLL